MLQLVIGPPKSGKSVFAERLIAAAPGPAVYIGTLPDKDFYRETIRLHQERRPECWGLRELTGEPQTDVEIISQALQDFRAVLLDGLTFYLFRLMTLFEINLGASRGRVAALASEAAGREGLVVVSDAPVPTLLVPEERHLLLQMHALLARRARSVTYFENGSGRDVSRSEVFRINRSWPCAEEDSRLSWLRRRA